MENQENNNLSELDQLKAQYETLKQQFDQQEIVNDRLMKSSIKRNVDFYMRYRWKQFILYPLAILAGLLITKWEFGNNLSLRLFWIAYCLVGFAVEIWMLRKLHVKTIENDDLLTLSNQARGFKLFYTLFTILSAVSMLILSVGLFAHAGYDHFPSFGRFIAVLCVTLVFFVVFGVIGFRHVTRPCDEIIRQIEASGTTENKKTGFDKKQKCFCVVMFVAFLCLDVWAYMIVASHLKLPPMWQQVTYTRNDDSLIVEDDLSIWEVFTDTLVSAEDVLALTKLWQEDPSLVVAKGVDDNGQTVNLYALKMASPEGPLVSSKRIGGKPVVKQITMREPKVDHGKETIPVVFFMTPEAKQLWSKQFDPNEEMKSIDIALVVDGVVYKKQTFTSLRGVTNNSFFIQWEWGKDKLDDFCKRLIRQ
jgi:hypothetical protein